MEILFELLFSFIGEILLQVVFEILVDVGFGKVIGRARSGKRSPVMSFIGYTCLGVMAGGLSLLLFPAHLVHDTWLRVTLLATIPVLAGWLMTLIGNRREARGSSRRPMESWANGCIFALAMGLVRFFYAK